MAIQCAVAYTQGDKTYFVEHKLAIAVTMINWYNVINQVKIVWRWIDIFVTTETFKSIDILYQYTLILL